MHLYFGCHILKKTKITAKTHVKKLFLSIFHLGVLWFLILTFKSLIHFKLVFVSRVRQWCSFIPLYMVSEELNDHLFKRLHLPLYILGSFFIS